MHKIIILILTLSCLILSGCVMDDDEVDSALTIINNSDNEINVYFMFVFENRVPDFPELKPELISVPSHSNFTGKSEFIRLLRPSNRLLYLYIFDKKQVDSIAWKEIIKNNMYLYQYDLSLQDLQDRNWQIQYNDE